MCHAVRRFGVEAVRLIWRVVGMNPTTTPGGRALLAAWLICGVLDINAAFLSAYLQAGRSPLWVLQAVASALLGAESFKQGNAAAAFGLGLHFCVAFNAAAVFWLLSRRWPAMLQHAVPAGLLHGAAVYLFMNCATIPFASWFRSLYLHTPLRGMAPLAWAQFGIHLTCVGLAISLSVKRFSCSANPSSSPDTA